MFERTLTPKFASLFDEMSTQMDANNHKHSLLDTRPS